MDSKRYLVSYGWKEGEGLKKGGLKKPILVKQKRDTKGLGNDINDGEVWWEKLFDVQLKSLDVYKDGEVKFEQNEIKVDKSPLYSMFVKGEGLTGTIGVEEETVQVAVKKQIVELKKERERKKAKKSERGDDKKDRRKLKEAKERKKDKKKRKDKKDREDKEKKDRKDRKVKKDKKNTETKLLDEKHSKEKKSKSHKRSKSERSTSPKRIKV